MPRKSREEEIIRAIRLHLVGAIKSLKPITDMRLMKAAGCARATYYRYVTKGSEIELEIEIARREQEKYVNLAGGPEDSIGGDPSLRNRLEKAELGDRELLAFISRMTANLILRGVSTQVIQAAQREAMPHPNRNYSHVGRGRRRK